MDKQYLCFWDGTHYEEEKTEMKSVDYFNKSNGYFSENIEEIKNLEVGKSFTPDIGHIITRVK